MRCLSSSSKLTDRRNSAALLDNSSFCARISRAQMSASRFGLGKFESIVILTLRRRRDSGAADNRKTVCSLKWRRKRDSNPRASFPANGFQDRRFQPLTHSSSHHDSARSRSRGDGQNPVFGLPVHSATRNSIGAACVSKTSRNLPVL